MEVFGAIASTVQLASALTTLLTVIQDIRDDFRVIRQRTVERQSYLMSLAAVLSIIQRSQSQDWAKLEEPLQAVRTKLEEIQNLLDKVSQRSTASFPVRLWRVHSLTRAENAISRNFVVLNQEKTTLILYVASIQGCTLLHTQRLVTQIESKIMAEKPSSAWGAGAQAPYPTSDQENKTATGVRSGRFRRHRNNVVDVIHPEDDSDIDSRDIRQFTPRNKTTEQRGLDFLSTPSLQRSELQLHNPSNQRNEVRDMVRRNPSPAPESSPYPSEDEPNQEEEEDDNPAGRGGHAPNPGPTPTGFHNQQRPGTYASYSTFRVTGRVGDEYRNAPRGFRLGTSHGPGFHIHATNVHAANQGNLVDFACETALTPGNRNHDNDWARSGPGPGGRQWDHRVS
ncbi:Uu.00g098600.m01.CDS01 [Anthostomella pinea]|uniref:Uu.00g098600.m01.CDS01 n=1 Tax=Anthostomella pinea TaxID=933095 RepID=A0AAI8VDM8_9PEZI|nr:Uu.00g098600.m01.CDS01 [Anthostomella pinea]